MKEGIVILCLIQWIFQQVLSVIAIEYILSNLDHEASLKTWVVFIIRTMCSFVSILIALLAIEEEVFKVNAIRLRLLGRITFSIFILQFFITIILPFTDNIPFTKDVQIWCAVDLAFSIVNFGAFFIYSLQQ
ncbi:centromere protein I [Acrasis kona]|uniref:Centromere protein I n=1 Tax=Acrasis kona TaxID=1008807 RepID=A0AAW2ZI77_9EUKA